MKSSEDPLVRFSKLLICLIVVGFMSGCTTGTQLLNEIPVHKVSFEVVDQNGDPVPGASVEASNGNSTATDSSGVATLRFGSAGVHNVTVAASNYAPTNLTVTLPTDNGKTMTARLADQVTYTTSRFSGMTGQMYPMLFTYLFNTQGYSMELTNYGEGEWTKWRFNSGDSQDDSMILKKAFLKKLDNGQQWWQIRLYESEKEEPSYTAEILFSQDRTSIRRYREKLQDRKAQEKPVREGWYSEPASLTEESIEGAVEEEGIKVELPSGSFTTDLINFGLAPGIALKIWRATEVPGGAVKYENVQTEEGQEKIYSSELIDYGTDAKTVLKSY